MFFIDVCFRLSAGWGFMECRVCCAVLYSSRSDLCIACSSVSTIQKEFLEAWANTRLRNIGADVALSAARTIRSLRIYGKSDCSTGGGEAPVKLEEKEAPKKEVKDPLPRRRRSDRKSSPGPKKKEAKDKPLKAEVEEPSGKALKRDNQGGPARGSTEKPSRTSPPSCYTYSTSSEDFEVKDLTGRDRKPESGKETVGATPKSGAEVPKKPLAAKFEAGTAADKAESKRAYLASLKTQVVLREGPKEKGKELLNQSLLEVKGEEEYPLREEKSGKRKRKGDHGEDRGRK